MNLAYFPAMARGPRLDALPLFARTHRSRSLPGIYAPALCPGSTTGVVHYVRLHGIAAGEGGVPGPGQTA